MGFGKHSSRTYGETLVMAPSYVTWCINTADEEDRPYWRLVRFANWARNVGVGQRRAIEKIVRRKWPQAPEHQNGFIGSVLSELGTGRDGDHGSHGRREVGEDQSLGGRAPGPSEEDRGSQDEQEVSGSEDAVGSWSDDWLAEDDAFVALGLQSKLSFSQARSLGKNYDADMQATVAELTASQSVRLVEVCCSPDSRLSAACIRRFGPGSAVRLSFWNGGDIETQKGRAFVQKTIKELKPDLSVALFPPYS